MRSLTGITAKQAILFLVVQLFVAIVLSSLLLFFDWTTAYSGFAGGMIAWFATAWFAIKVFNTDDLNPEVVIKKLYFGEINKILLTVAMFAAAFVLIRPVNAAALIGVYFLVYITPAIVSSIVDDESKYKTEQ